MWSSVGFVTEHVFCECVSVWMTNTSGTVPGEGLMSC